MAKSGHWGDHIVLQAAADMLNIRIRVLSTANPKLTVIEPVGMTLRQPRPIIDIGHLFELHYVALVPKTEGKIVNIHSCSSFCSV